MQRVVNSGIKAIRKKLFASLITKREDTLLEDYPTAFLQTTLKDIISLITEVPESKFNLACF